MLWAACCLGFFGFFQPSIHMTVADLQGDSLVNPTCFEVHIKCPKTDPFRMGCDIYVGCGEGSVCPIRSLGDFLALRGSSESALFTLSDGHSFCIGAATTAAARGVPDHLIKTLGRWSSDAYQIYIRTPVSSIVHVSRQLAA